MKEHIIIAGAGGQGIMLLGKILAETAMGEGKFVTWLPSYGAEVRGGTAHCMLVISDEEIGSPYVDKADTLIVMNEPSLVRFQSSLKRGGLLIVNSSLAKMNHALKGVKVHAQGFTDEAVELGNIKVANMVALGSFISCKGIIRKETALKVIKKNAPPGRQDLIVVNSQAIERGVVLR